MPRTCKAKFELRREAEREAERMRIPLCPSCFFHCSVCSSGKISPPHDFCCLSGDEIDRSIMIAAEILGESGDAYDAEHQALEKRETQQ